VGPVDVSSPKKGDKSATLGETEKNRLEAHEEGRKGLKKRYIRSDQSRPVDEKIEVVKEKKKSRKRESARILGSTCWN